MLPLAALNHLVAHPTVAQIHWYKSHTQACMHAGRQAHTQTHTHTHTHTHTEMISSITKMGEFGFE